MASLRPSSRAAAAGVWASLAALTVGYWLPGIGLPRLDFPLWNGNLLVPDFTNVSFAWSIGLLQTLGLGSFLSLVYQEWFRDRLPGGGPVRGAIWGLVLGVVSGLTVFPLLYGADVYGLGWDASMPVSLALWHLTWGVVIGVLDTPD